jgi:hypothetical protein
LSLPFLFTLAEEIEVAAPFVMNSSMAVSSKADVEIVRCMLVYPSVEKLLGKMIPQFGITNSI